MPMRARCPAPRRRLRRPARGGVLPRSLVRHETSAGQSLRRGLRGPHPGRRSRGNVEGALTGRITYIGASTLTIQAHGTSVGVITALTRTANGVAAGGWPYVWGGGHSEAGVASIGGRGPGYNGRRRGFDCSGSVTAVLSGAGLWPAGAGVPGDLGVVRELLAEGLIARGPGRAPNAVNLYDDSVGISRPTAYNERRRNAEFARAWAEVEEATTEWLEREALRRAAEGVVEKESWQIDKDGKRVLRERTTRYSDALLVFLLKARRPEVYRENLAIDHSGVVGREPAPRVTVLDGRQPIEIPADKRRAAALQLLAGVDEVADGDVVE